MSDDAVNIDLVHLDGSAVLAVRGEIDMLSADQFRDALTRTRAFNVPVVLDFSGVTFMDSSGLNALLSVFAGRSEGERGVVIRHPQRQVQLVLHATGLEWLIEQQADDARIRESAPTINLIVG